MAGRKDYLIEKPFELEAPAVKVPECQMRAE
jgi:hypothetical protein